MSGWVTADAIIRDETGLHARPAVKLTKLAKTFSATVEISANGADWVNAKSPNKVMKLKAPAHATLAIRADGDDAEDAATALRDLVNRNFEDAPVG